MDRLTLATAVALCAVATIGGGVAVRVAALVGVFRIGLALALVGGPLLLVGVTAAASRPRRSTPYW